MSNPVIPKDSTTTKDTTNLMNIDVVGAYKNNKDLQKQPVVIGEREDNPLLKAGVKASLTFGGSYLAGLAIDNTYRAISQIKNKTYKGLETFRGFPMQVGKLNESTNSVFTKLYENYGGAETKQKFLSTVQEDLQKAKKIPTIETVLKKNDLLNWKSLKQNPTPIVETINPISGPKGEVRIEPNVRSRSNPSSALGNLGMILPLTGLVNIANEVKDDKKVKDYVLANTKGMSDIERMQWIVAQNKKNPNYNKVQTGEVLSQHDKDMKDIKSILDKKGIKYETKFEKLN